MNHKNKNMIKVLFCLLVLVIAGVIFSCSMKRKEKTAANEAILSEREAAEPTSEEEPAQLICVHVCGSVLHAGVYYLEKGARIHEAVALAGGMTDEADGQYVNLAKEAIDGSKIYIPTKEEVANGTVPPEEEDRNGIVNINQASMEDLKQLPGIGDIKAEAIISYRESKGAFAPVEEIMNVAGIKESSYEQIKEHIRV